MSGRRSPAIVGLLTMLVALCACPAGAVPNDDELRDHQAVYRGLVERFEANPQLAETRSSGWKPLNRALWYSATRPVPDGRSAARMRADALATARSRAAGHARGAGWFATGPAHLSGRCLSVDFDPTDSDIVYVGSAGGGLWRSSDGGDTWTALTDDLPTLAVGAVCVLAWDPNTILIGTGEGSGAGFGPFGAGLFRSTDGGQSWQTTSLSYPIAVGHGFNHIEDNLVTHTILAAANDGLYRSTDDGVTWTLIEGNGNFFDVRWKTDDPARVYVTKGRDPFFNFQSDNGVKISTNDGLSFLPLGSGQPFGGNIGQTKIAVTPADPAVIYAHYTNASNFQTLGIYRSVDGGETWELRLGTLNMTGGQGWYNVVMAIDPNNANRVITGGVNLYTSANGGLTFSNLNQNVPLGNQSTPHWDLHALRYLPGSDSELWLCTDGGPWRSLNDGFNWASRREGIITYQFYDICVSQNAATFMLGGTQDNGIPRRDGFEEWSESTFIADGMVCNVDPTDDEIIYADWQNGNHIKSIDGGDSWFSIQNGITNNGIWTTPVDLDPNDTDHLYTMSVNGIFRSRNAGALWVNVAPHVARWISISPVAGNVVWTVSNTSGVWHTPNDGGGWVFDSSAPAVGLATKIHAHPTELQTAFVCYGGYATGAPHLARTTDNGVTWEDVTGDFPDVPANTFIVDPDRPEDWYIGSDAGVWKSMTEGEHWFSYGSGLANATITDLEINRGARKLVAGTHGRGAWEVDIPLTPIAVDPGGAPPPRRIMLDPPYPNPASDVVVFRAAARSDGVVSLAIFDASGRLVARAEPPRGDGVVRTTRWQVGGHPPGVYFAVLEAGGERISRKVIVRR